MGHQVDNSNSTIQKLNLLYCDPELSDLRLLVGEKTFHAHKLILSISSDVFKTMLTNPTWPEAYTSQIVLQEEPECVEVFEDFLRYLYTGRINMDQMSVLPVLILADKYNINDLSEVCINYMCYHYVAPQNQSQVVSWLNYAMMCEHKKLQQVCEQYITWNFQFVLETPDFMSISLELLIWFLKSSEIVVTSEYLLYQRVKAWILLKMSTQELKSCSKKPISDLECVVSKIFCLIRFEMMSSQELKMVENDDLVCQFSNLFHPLLFKALHFHHCSSNTRCLPSKQNKQDIPTPDCMYHTRELISDDIQTIQCKIAKGTNSQHVKSSLSISEISKLDGSCFLTHMPSTTRASFKKMLTYPSEQNKQYSIVTPRLYTCDTWCTEMYMSEVTDMTPGHVSGAFFSTPVTGSESDDTCWDWHIDLYPKGVTFRKCMVIGLYWNCDIDEVTYDTVRLTVTSNTSEVRKVQVSILVMGKQDGIEYVAKGTTRTCYFDDSCASHNFNDLVQFSEIQTGKSKYLIGDENTFKVRIIIRPLNRNL